MMVRVDHVWYLERSKVFTVGKKCTDTSLIPVHTFKCSGILGCVCAQSCPTLCDPMNCSPPGSSVHGILQAIIPEWVGIFCSRGSSQHRDWACISGVSCIDRRILSHWDPWWSHTAWHGLLWPYERLVVLELRKHELTKCIRTETHTHTHHGPLKSLCLSGCIFASGKSSEACQLGGIIKLRRATQ